MARARQPGNTAASLVRAARHRSPNDEEGTRTVDAGALLVAGYVE